MEENTVPSVFDEMEHDPSRFEYATTGQRLANYVVDIAVIYALFFLACFVLGYLLAVGGMTVEEIDSLVASRAFLYGVFYVIAFVTYTLMEGLSKGRTLGKLITRTVAVKQDFSPLDWKHTLIRSLCRLIPFDVLSGLSGSPWHDKFSKTHVVKKLQKL